MLPASQYLTSVSRVANLHFCRFGIALSGGSDWKVSVIEDYINSNQERLNTVFQLGGEPLVGNNIYTVKPNKGQSLLGQECDLLICDFTEGFDANSFSAAIGTLVGGGLLVVIGSDTHLSQYARCWVESIFSELIEVKQQGLMPEIPDVKIEKGRASSSEQQKAAIEAIKKVSTGHRKRPFVLTANRGRGKSSALGLAAGELISSRQLSNPKLRILVTAPKPANVEPVFRHAKSLLPSATSEQKHTLTFGESSLEFIAPDDLLLNQPECDLLLVDEASALPLSQLKQMVTHYHRVVFSTTIHGYEGCGRGFTLKFLDWLKQNRPGTKQLHLDSPFRWIDGDPLETWHYKSMLLDTELDSLDFTNLDTSDLSFSKIEKSQLLSDKALATSLFALLINAHYQTTPNDFLFMLEDECCHVFACYAKGDMDRVVGCVLAIEEGSLEDELIKDIQLGKRRPKGHLVASSIANHCGITEAASCRSLRISRIATHPDGQRKGIGRLMLQAMTREQSNYEYLSTSFGATQELLPFWKQSGYQVVRIGTQRDQASGCYSVMLVKPLSSASELWVEYLRGSFQKNFSSLLAESLNHIEVDIIRSLLEPDEQTELKPLVLQLLSNYAHGGNSYDSCAHLFCLLIQKDNVSQLSEVFINRVLKNHTWAETVKLCGFAGRKQAEAQFRQDIVVLLGDFTV